MQPIPEYTDYEKYGSDSLTALEKELYDLAKRRYQMEREQRKRREAAALRKKYLSAIEKVSNRSVVNQRDPLDSSIAATRYFASVLDAEDFFDLSEIIEALVSNKMQDTDNQNIDRQKLYREEIVMTTNRLMMGWLLNSTDEGFNSLPVDWRAEIALKTTDTDYYHLIAENMVDVENPSFEEYESRRRKTGKE